MATASNSESMGPSSDDFSCCDICFEKYNDPRILTCGHTFCKDCLDKLASRSGLQILCPTCRSPTTVLNNVDELPVNYKVVELIQMMKNVRFTATTKTEKEQICQLCPVLDRSNKVAKHFCVSCNKYMCNTCKDDHTKTKVFEDHVFAKMPTVSHESATCKIHGSEEVKYYCKDCNLLLCNACAIQPLHRDHSTSTIEDISSKYATEIKELKAKLITTSQELKAKHAHLMNNQKEHFMAMRDKIAKRIEEACSIMSKWGDTCMAQINKVEHPVDNVLETYEVQIASAKSLLTIIDPLGESSSFLPLLIQGNQLLESFTQDQTVDVETTFSLEDVQLDTCINFILGKLSITTKDGVFSAGGERKTLKPTFTSYSDSNTTARKYIAGESGALNQTYSDPNTTAKKYKAGGERGALGSMHIDPTTTARKYIVDALGDKREALDSTYSDPDATRRKSIDGVIDGKGETYHDPIPTVRPASTTLVGQETRGKPKLLWQCNKGSKHGEVYSISDITLKDNDDIIVSEYYPHYGNKQLQCLSMEGQFQSIIEVGNIEPWGVMVHQSGEIFITDRTSQTVQVYNSQGVYSRTWREKMFNVPCGIASLSNGDIVVCDQNNNTVSIHSPGDGQRITTLGNIRPDSASLIEPRFVCTNSQDHIIVTCMKNNFIDIFDTTGKLLCNISETEPGKALNKPRGVCVEPGTDCIIVIMNDDNSIVKFDANGRYMEKLLSGDDGVREPWAVACGTDGNIVVGERRDSQDIHALKKFSFG